MNDVAIFLSTKGDMMKLDDLLKRGIPARIIERWRQRQGESLLPVQSRAVRKGLLDESYDGYERKAIKMIISAPTSSGKSFCAEMAAVKTLTERKKTVMLFPLKSLAEQTYELLKKSYEPLGVKVLIVTGDHPENDRDFVLGNYHLAVCIYEKFDLFLSGSLDHLKNIGLIVVDEIQTIAEPGRGAMLERLLTKIKASVYNPSLIGLSAVIGDDGAAAGSLAGWLGAELIEERQRPVDLLRGVAAEGSFKFRSFNDGVDGSEPFAKIEAGEEMFDSFAAQLKEETGSTLVFLKSRKETVDYAFRLAASVGWPEGKKALSKLKDEEASYLIRSLCRALNRGVAFHNADLSFAQRQIVEQAFIDKEVRVVFSTTTLAMGVNLAADNVYLETVKYSSGVYGGKPSLVPVSRSEFDNMTGRAGRFDHRHSERKAGRAIVLASSEFDRDILWGNYIAAEQPEKLNSVFARMPISDWLLDMIACGLLTDGDELSLTALLSQTYYAASGQKLSVDILKAGRDKLIECGMVEFDLDSGRLCVSSLGRAVSGCGLSVAEAVNFKKKLNRSHPESSFGWLALALSSTGWQLPPSILSFYEQRNNFPLKLLYQQFNHLRDEAAILLGEDYHSRPIDYRQAAALKGLLLLEEWRHLRPIQKLEEQFQMHLGQIVNLGESAAHLLWSLAGLLKAVDRETVLKSRLVNLAYSVRFGLPSEMFELHRKLGGLLNRSHLAKFQKMGISTLAGLIQLTGEELEAIVSDKAKLSHINEKIDKLKEEVQVETRTEMTRNQIHQLPPTMILQPETIEIEGSYEGERYLVKINGYPVHLTGKSFKYFTKLAWSRMKGESGWIYKEDIEQGFNQARYLYRMKGEIQNGLGADWPLVENNRLGYYRLNADPAKIKINLDNLKDHPDYEIRALVEANRLN